MRGLESVGKTLERLSIGVKTYVGRGHWPDREEEEDKELRQQYLHRFLRNLNLPNLKSAEVSVTFRLGQWEDGWPDLADVLPGNAGASYLANGSLFCHRL